MAAVNGAPEGMVVATEAPPRTRPQAEAVVDLGAVAHNTRILAEAAGSAGLMAVVKADGYNHGAVAVARTALDAGATSLGVATVSEGLALRAAGISAPVLSWLNAPGTDYAAALAADVEIAVCSPRQIDEVAAAARRAGTPAVVSVKVDTGMNRGGVGPAEWEASVDALARQQRAGTLHVHGLFSHLASADEPADPYTDLQRRRFEAATATMVRAGVPPQVRHLANSAAALLHPELAYDLVRPGIALYGLSPAPQRGTFGLRPAMTLRGTVALVKRVAAGESVSYGHEWTAATDTTVALIPVGYADGISRHLKNRFSVAIRGVRRPGVGRVSMDQVVVDLGADTDVDEGDDAWFFGAGDHGESHVQEWADALDTITYEVVTGIRGRVVRTTVGVVG